MQLDLQVNESDYKIRKTTNYDGTISIVLTPKKRNCKVCSKQFQSNGREFLLWTTKDNYTISGWFCRKHFIQANKLIKICK